MEIGWQQIVAENVPNLRESARVIPIRQIMPTITRVSIPSLSQSLVRRHQPRVALDVSQAERNQPDGEASSHKRKHEEQGHLDREMFVVCDLDHNRRDQDHGREQGVETRDQKKLDEELDVALADARPDPGAVMVVYLHAHPAVLAVERPRWPENVAVHAESELVRLVSDRERL